MESLLVEVEVVHITGDLDPCSTRDKLLCTQQAIDITYRLTYTWVKKSWYRSPELVEVIHPAYSNKNRPVDEARGSPDFFRIFSDFPSDFLTFRLERLLAD